MIRSYAIIIVSPSSFAGDEQIALGCDVQHVCVCVCVCQVVFRHPHFISYFRKVTPEEELGGLNIGSRPARYSTLEALSARFFPPEYADVAAVAAVAASCKLSSAKLHTGKTEHTMLHVNVPLPYVDQLRVRGL